MIDYMKRSKVIEFLDQELSDFLNISNGYKEDGNSAKLFLKRMEEFGFRVPLISTDSLEGQLSSSYNKYEDE